LIYNLLLDKHYVGINNCVVDEVLNVKLRGSKQNQMNNLT